MGPTGHSHRTAPVSLIRRAPRRSGREKVSLDAAFDSFDEQWSPRIAAEVDDHAVKLVTVDGEFVWHSHAEADELFLVHSGEVTIELRDEPDVHLGPGELGVVPAGVEHRPVAEEVAEVLLFERTGTQNTGDVEDERTTDVKRFDRTDP